MSGNSLETPMSEQMWLELYRKAIEELSQGKQDFNAMFAGNVFDLVITFVRIDKNPNRND